MRQQCRVRGEHKKGTDPVWEVSISFSAEETLILVSEGWGSSQLSKEGVSFVGKEREGQCSCGAKREGKQEIRLARQPGTGAEEGILLQTC